MIRCPNCDMLIDEGRFDLDEDLSDDDRARYAGYVAGRGGESREGPEIYEAPQSNITGACEGLLALNRQWLTGYDAGAAVRSQVQAAL